MNESVMEERSEVRLVSLDAGQIGMIDTARDDFDALRQLAEAAPGAVPGSPRILAGAGRTCSLRRHRL